MKATKLLLVVSLVLIGPTPAQGTNPVQKSEVPHQVTLITGDVVNLYENNSFTVQAAERPDGRQVTFTGRTGDTIAGLRDFYVTPSDVEGDERLDPELFNVRGLVREGHAGTPRVIVAGKGLKVDHRQQGQFWRGMAKGSKVWLDHRRRVALDRSVGQIGAPDAWAAGHSGTGVTVAVIDTGIDATHPDLADRVIGSQNFTEDVDAGDYYGHGTHVASTIAGSGAASGGQYKGVAPGARLINAKACGGDGYCYDSWLMAAMDYAAHSGAKVVNLSVGGGVSDGTDPLSSELNRLTEETGVLFVVAAGNSGEYGSVTVGAPGAAAAALTVGAVDRSDKLAYFSSRGPRYGDAGIKPDVTAPGVGIVAARAVDTGMGEPVGDHYTAASGTSMATPHVAGAAAILAGQHTDWKAGRIKDVLVSTTKATGGKVIDEGSGRIDISRGYQAKLTGSATVDFGRLGRHAIRLRKLTYRNDGDVAVRLNLSLAGAGWNGRPFPVGAVVLTPSVTVPAHGSATAFLVVNTFVGDAGSYSGVVTATGGGASMRTPVSYYLVPPTHQLTVRITGHDGQLVRSGVYIMRDDFDPQRNNDPFAQLMFNGTYHEDGTVTAEVPSGTYTLLSSRYDVTLTQRARYTALSKVDVMVRRAITVNLDARKAVPMTVDAGDAQARVRFVSFSRSVRGGAGVTMGCVCLDAEAFATPTPAPIYGSLSLQDTWTFADRISTLSVTALHDPFAVSAKFPGQRSVPVVWAGDGTDFTGIDVTGKVALVGLKVPENSADPIGDAYLAGRQAAINAAAAGAAAIAAFVDVEGAIAQSNSSKEIPYLAVNRADGLGLKQAGSIDIRTKANPEFIYNLHYSTPNGIAANLSHRVDRSKLTRVRSEYHADIAGLSLWRAWVGFRKDAGGMMTMPAVYLRGPVALDEYVGGSADAIENVNWTRIGVIGDGSRNQITMYNRRPVTGKDIWFAGPSSPGGFDPNNGSFYRFNLPGGSQLLSPSHYMGDGSSGHLLDVDYFGYHATSYRLFREGTEIPGQYPGFSRFPYFPVPNEAATYRLDAVTVLPKSGLGGPTQAIRRLSHRVDTSWTFRSDRGNPLPCYEGSPFECKNESLLQPVYDLGLDLFNKAPAGRHTFGVQVLRTDTGAPAVLAGLSARYSTDEGLTWHEATVAGGRVTVENPGGGFVWLRTEAWTPGGDRVVQTVQRIYSVA